MSDFTLRLPDGVPNTEVSVLFLQAMVDRMAMSFYKYGLLSQVFPQKVDAMETMQRHLDRYRRYGNTEGLVDASNYLMIEFMHPRHPNAHFRATDSRESPGRQWTGELDPSPRRNNEL